MKSVRTELSWQGGPSNVIGCHTERPPKLLVRAMMTVKNRWLMTKTVWSQVGSYFGHSVAVNDINGDGLDDVIIGAPMHTDFSQVIRIFIIFFVIFFISTLKPDGRELWDRQNLCCLPKQRGQWTFQTVQWDQWIFQNMWIAHVIFYSGKWKLVIKTIKCKFVYISFQNEIWCQIFVCPQFVQNNEVEVESSFI